MKTNLPSDVTDSDLQIQAHAVSADELRAFTHDCATRVVAIGETAKAEKRELNEAEAERIATLDRRQAAAAGELERRESRPRARTVVDDVPGAHGITHGAFGRQGGLLLPGTKPRDAVRTIFGPIAGASRDVSLEAFLAQVRNTRFDPQAATATEGIGVDGGFSVPPSHFVAILAELFENSELWKLCRMYAVAGNSAEIALPDTQNQLTALGNLEVAWKAEGSSNSGQILKWREVSAKLNKLLAIAEASNELLEDGKSYVEMVTTTLAADAGMRVDAALISGTGAGMPRGFLRADSLITVTPESGQAAATVLFQNVMKLWTRMHPACKKRAVWVVSPDVMPQLISMSFPGNGAPVLLTGTFNGAATTAPVPTIFGRPIIESTLAPTLGTEGDISLVDFSQMAFVAKSAMKIEANPYIKFETDATQWRLRWRVESIPLWDEPITPRNGGATLGWAVTLDDRA